jgi:hypothetical protein
MIPVEAIGFAVSCGMSQIRFKASENSPTSTALFFKLSQLLGKD